MSTWAQRAEVLRGWLVHRRWPAFVGLLGVLLTLPTLPFGFLVDDLLHAFYLRGGDVPGGPRGVWDLYRFADAGPGLQRAIDEGIFVWWTSPDLKFAFFRPLSSLSIALDHTLFTPFPWVSHLLSCALYGGLCALVALLFRRVIPGAAGGLAALLFAVDDGHHFPVLWLANRHAVLAMIFGVAALLAHVRSRQEGGPRWQAPLAFAFALAAGESAVGMLPFFLAWAWWMDRGGRRAALVALAPLLAPLVPWAVVYVVGGYGTASSGLYLDPLHQPLAFAAALVTRLPRLLAAQMFFPPADIWPLVPPTQARVADLVLLGLLAAFGAALFRATRGHPARPALAFGTVFTLLPACATFPSDRLLLQCSLGASGLVAIAIVRAARRITSAADRTPGPLRSAGPFAVLLVLLHLVLAPLLLPLRGYQSGQFFTIPIARGAASLPTDERIRTQTAVILSSPDTLWTTYMFLQLQVAGLPVPERTHLLAVSHRGSVRIDRETERTLLLSADAELNADVFSLLYREPIYRVGEVVRAGDLRAEIVALGADGLPRQVRFTFDAPITSEGQRWLVWKGQGYEEVPIVAIGEHVDIPSTDWLEAMQP